MIIVGQSLLKVIPLFQRMALNLRADRKGKDRAALLLDDQ